MLKIYLLPIGIQDTPIMDAISRAVGRAFGLAPADRLQPIEIPQHALNRARGQYHSTTILRRLTQLMPADALRLLGVTNVDLYVPQLNFVFGEAAVDGRVSIISLHRLRPEFYGGPTDEKLFTERAVKEAVHELGHTFGLRHCSNSRCVMYFSNSIQDTDGKSAGFCTECIEKLHRKLAAVKTSV